MFDKGERIELRSMSDDPDPIPVGTRGTVRDCTRIDFAGPGYWQVSVDWDNGRTLGLCCPPDQAILIREELEKDNGSKNDASDSA